MTLYFFNGFIKKLFYCSILVFLINCNFYLFAQNNSAESKELITDFTLPLLPILLPQTLTYGQNTALNPLYTVMDFNSPLQTQQRIDNAADSVMQSINELKKQTEEALEPEPENNEKDLNSTGVISAEDAKKRIIIVHTKEELEEQQQKGSLFLFPYPCHVELPFNKTFDFTIVCLFDITKTLPLPSFIKLPFEASVKGVLDYFLLDDSPDPVLKSVFSWDTYFLLTALQKQGLGLGFIYEKQFIRHLSFRFRFGTSLFNTGITDLSCMAISPSFFIECYPFSLQMRNFYAGLGLWQDNIYYVSNGETAYEDYTGICFCPLAGCKVSLPLHFVLDLFIQYKANLYFTGQSLGTAQDYTKDGWSFKLNFKRRI